MAAKTKLIEFGNNHKNICGTTTEGKTYAAIVSAAAYKGPVFFMNIKNQQKDIPSKFITVGPDDDLNIIRKALYKGAKINFIMDRKKSVNEKQIEVLVNEFFMWRFHEKGLQLQVLADEYLLMTNKAKGYLGEIAAAGASCGISLVSLAQRLSMIPNDIMTQAHETIFFPTEYEDAYFTRYGINNQILEEKLQEGGKYSYVSKVGREYYGPFKVK